MLLEVPTTEGKHLRDHLRLEKLRNFLLFTLSTPERFLTFIAPALAVDINISARTRTFLVRKGGTAVVGGSNIICSSREKAMYVHELVWADYEVCTSGRW